MGKLVLRLTRAGERAGEHDRILGRLRRLRARPTGSHVEGRGKAAAEIYEFTTTGIPAAKPRRRSPLWISPVADQRLRFQQLAAATAVGLALTGRQFIRKEETVTPTRKVRRLALGKYESEARRIYELARRLVEGEGPPEDLRMPNPQVTIVPHATDRRSKHAWGVGGIGVALEMQRPYPPIEAMVVSGYVLFGVDWPTLYRTLKLPASLDAAYWALEAHFAREESPALVTIPKTRPQIPTRKRSLKAVEDERPAQRALPPPTRRQG